MVVKVKVKKKQKMVLTVATVSSFSEYHNDGYQKNDQHGLGVSLVTYTVCINCFVFVLKYRLPNMVISSYCAKILSLILRIQEVDFFH